jgi:two-component system cell cycle response regulator DivK
METLLYVEDNEDNIYMLSKRLERGGFTLLIARNGIEGLAMALENHPDLIIMDQVLPEIDGFEAARQIRVHQQTREIPIIALPTGVLPEHQHKAIEAGCDDFETKPVNFPRLLGKIRHLMGMDEE